MASPADRVTRPFTWCFITPGKWVPRQTASLVCLFDVLLLQAVRMASPADRVTRLLTDAVLRICHSELTYQSHLTVRGQVEVMVDDHEQLLVRVDEVLRLSKPLIESPPVEARGGDTDIVRVSDIIRGNNVLTGRQGSLLGEIWGYYCKTINYWRRFIWRNWRNNKFQPKLVVTNWKKYGPQPLSFNDIAKLNLSQIVIFSKPPNIIDANISRFTVSHLFARYISYFWSKGDFNMP